MKPIRLAAVLVAALLAATALPAARSGPLGVYAIVERVVFEPSQAAPERAQVWGAFAYVNGTPGGREFGVSAAKRGYLYFKLPDVAGRGGAPALATSIELVKREWADLAAVAGTGQAVGFGAWWTNGAFDWSNGFDPAALDRTQTATGTVRIRTTSEAPTAPVVYYTNSGLVRLSATGNHADLVAQLKAALTK